MNRSLLAAPAVAALLLAGTAGVAYADEDATARACDVVRSELVDAEAAAKLPVTIGGAKLPDLSAVQSLYDSSEGVPVLEDTAAQAKAILDAAASVEVLTREETTCVEATGPTTDTPAPTENPAPTTEAPTSVAPPATTDTVYYANCAAVRAAGVDPVFVGQPGYRAGLDSDNDGIGCEVDDLDTVGDDAGTLGGSSSDGDSGVVDSVPSGSVDTGYVAA